MTIATVLLATVVTAGWENIEPMRTEVEPAKVLWTAPLEQEGLFKVEKRDGAEGTVTFKDGLLTVDKTNDRGLIVITAPSFQSVTNQPIRFMIDCHCDRGDYFYAQAGIRAYDRAESLTPYWELETRHFSMGGAEEMRTTVNQAPSMFNRKYCHLRVKTAEGRVTPVLSVSGSASRTTWKNWLAEDLDAADAKWAGYFEARTAHDHASERIEEAEFDRQLAVDIDHYACLKKINGVTRLVIDGEVAYPGAYRAKGAFGKDILMETFAAGPMVREGVKLVVKGIAMGGSSGATDGLKRRYWTEAGFDAVGAVRDIKNSLRITPGALCILSVSCNAYPNFTLKEHPDELWVKPDGSIVKGTSGSCVETYDDMGIKDTNRWPWVSYASPSWRKAVCDNLTALIDELKRQGLSKRIVGLHLSGYHDGQFHSPYEDHSKWSKIEFEKYLKEDPLAVNDLGYFSKLLGFKAQEEFARCFKRELGKPAIVIRWNMGAFSGMPDLTTFAFSDAVDIIVPQPTYETRRPGMAAEMKLPYSSFDLHGKMYWNEFDLRTYAALETWATPGVVATKGLGQSDDFTMWKTVYRKLAGMMFANNSGYWFYDMGGGWFSAPEIAHDIGSAFAMGRKILAKPKLSSWKPSVAVIADEEGMGVNRPMNMAILRDQQKPFAASGVPFRFYLAEDILRDPSLVADCKTLVLAFFRKFDERRTQMYKALAKDGRTLILLSETAIDGGADLIGFKPTFETKRQAHDLVAEPGVPADEARSYLTGSRRRFWPTEVALGPRCTIAADGEMKVLARYVADRAVAIAQKDRSDCRTVYVAEPAGLTAALFNRLSRESGAYVPVRGGGLQVDMNGDFVSCHALKTGEWVFKLPFECKMINLKSGLRETVRNGEMKLSMTAGETCWFELRK